ncbi:MAG: diacylglycerol/lipid kinase family protein [Janthinobacterium lividum]
MSTVQRVVIVLNPNSTGDGPANAHGLQEQLRAKVPELPVELAETQYAGHAEELAYDAVAGRDGVLVVSASGDGGYHEVVNGVVRAGRDGHRGGLAAVLPSGNANDHATATQDRPLVEAILDAVGGAPHARMDLLEISSKGRGPRVAHSYIGVGISPVAAAALNQHDLDAFRETVLVIRAFWQYRPLMIQHLGKIVRIDSLVFANIDRMGKYAQLSQDSATDDGRYETILIPHRGKLRLMMEFIRIVRGRHENRSHTTPYEFLTRTPMPIQLDGEVIEVPGGATVTVRCLHRALRTVR